MKKFCFAVAASSLLTGCTFTPSINVLGAYFPDWLFCIVAGVSLTAIFNVIQSKMKIEHWLTPLAVTYPALATIFSLAAWLIFFKK